MIKIKSKEEIEIMKEGGKMLAKIMKELENKVLPGVTTKELDRAARALILNSGGKPSFLGYQGYPATLCVSINEEIVHGVPTERKLKEGDIVSLDLGLEHKRYHTDMAITMPVGNVSPDALRLIRVGKKALKRGIKKVRPGNTFGDIGNTIQRYVEDQGFNVVRDLCGHGIGKKIHEEPQVLNYGKRHKGPELCEGMVFCLEPMVIVGGFEIEQSGDEYAFKTVDGSLSSHFEHTVVVTEDGCSVLTEVD